MGEMCSNNQFTKSEILKSVASYQQLHYINYESSLFYGESPFTMQWELLYGRPRECHNKITQEDEVLGCAHLSFARTL